MRRTFSTLIIVMMVSVMSFGQALTGIKNIPGDYPSITSAISVLNSNGVGSGGVTFIVAGDYTETFTSLTNGLITATGTASDPVVFQRGATGANPVITGATPAAGTADYIIAFQGSDYITFDGIDVSEPSGAIEWGYAIVKESATNGSQHLTIKNCNITLKKTNTATIGIYSANVTLAAPTTQLPIADVAGTNSYNKYFSNVITGCYKGIVVNGFADNTAPYDYQDVSNEIGKDGGNTITGQGGSTVASSGIETYYQTRLFISNNTINGTVNGSAICYGIYLNTARNATSDVMGNTISLQYADATTTSFYGIYCNTGTTFTNNTLNVGNNIITGCSYVKPTSGAMYFMNIGISAAQENIFNNQITGGSYGNGTSTATGAIYGITTSGAPTQGPTVNIYGNSVTGLTRTQSVLGSGANNYMYILGGAGYSGPVFEVHDNVVANNVCPSSGSFTYGIYVNTSTQVKKCYNNSVYNLTGSYGAMVGMYITESYSSYTYNNRVSNLEILGTSATAAYVYGIWAHGSSFAGPMYIYNNYVSALKAPNSTTPQAMVGINAGTNGMDYLGVYNNSVYLDGTLNGANAGSSALSIGSYPKQADIRNNVIINLSNPGAGGYATALRSASYNVQTGIVNYSDLSDNNDFYAGSPAAGHVIAYITDGTSTVMDQTLDAFRARVWPKERNSISMLPTFLNTSTTPYDLHLDPAVPSQCESAGLVITAPVAITSDYDNDPRYPNAGYPVNPSFSPLAPDLGADEFGGLFNDLTAPSITYTPLMNTAFNSDRILTATITDISGVPVTGDGLPRLCWKINSGNWSYVQGVSNGNGQYTFTFGAGVALGDVVSYFVVAQDNAATPNTGAYPFLGASGFSANPPAAATPPSTPFTYAIVEGLCGIKSVGAGKDYATITAAVADLNSKSLTCPVVFELYDNLYTSPAETFPIVINQVAGASAINTITFRPAAGAIPLIQGAWEGTPASPPLSLITLNGAEYVIFDGSNSGGTDRSLTVRNTFATNFAAAMGVYNNGRPAAYITVKNCILQAHTDAVFNAQGFACYKTTGNGGYHDIVLNNNEISAAKYGVVLGGTASSPAYNIQVTNNLIGSMESSKTVAQFGVTLGDASNVLIEGNEIIGPAQGMAVPQTPTGINLEAGLSGIFIRKNTIHDIWQTALPGAPYGSASGIFNTSQITDLEISNNVIYNIKAPGQSTSVSGANATGIYFFKGGNIKLLHNTVVMQGNYMSATVATANLCIYFHNSMIGAIEVKDNILVNNSQPVSGTPASKTYCIGAGTNTVFTNLNYNDYYCNGIGPRIGYYNGADRPTLADWQSATNQDANSSSIDPVFTSSTNLKPTSTFMNKTGFYLPTVPTDIINVLRTDPPDMGAYEFSVMPILNTTAATDVVVDGATLNGTINPNEITSNVFFDYGTTTAYGTTVNGSPLTVNGAIILNISAPVTGLIQNTTYHFRIKAITNAGVVVYGNDMTFTTAPGIPENITVTGTMGEGASGCYNASNTITVAGGGNTFTVYGSGSATLIAWQKISILPGTTVYPGGYLHGYISYGTYCNVPEAPIYSNTTENTEVLTNTNSSTFSLYPNPTTGNFTLVQKGELLYNTVNVEVYTIGGKKVLSENIIGEKSHGFRFSEMQTGVYVVKIIADGHTESLKLVKM